MDATAEIPPSCQSASDTPAGYLGKTAAGVTAPAATQAELGIKVAPPVVTPEDVAQLVAVLSKADEHRAALPTPGRRKTPAGWMTAVEIAAIMGNGMTDREVRAIASAARPAVVSFPGSPGYKLWNLCTVEEIDHCIEAFQSQLRDMTKGMVMYLQAYHRRFRVAR